MFLLNHEASFSNPPIHVNWHAAYVKWMEYRQRRTERCVKSIVVVVVVFLVPPQETVA